MRNEKIEWRKGRKILKMKEKIKMINNIIIKNGNINNKKMKMIGKNIGKIIKIRKKWKWLKKWKGKNT